MRPYPAYQDSGVEWLGTIPNHWESKRLKWLVSLVDEPIERTDFLLAVENIESRTGKVINITEKKSYVGAIGGFKTGDTVFNKLRPYLSKVYYAERDGGCIGELLILRSKGELFGKFLFYRMLSSSFIDVIDGSTQGSKMPRASWEDFIRELFIPFPPLPEQLAIANYLDGKTAQIDNIVAQKQKLIELLREERAAVINQAVTKGLDPHTKIKHSGVDWLGDIPAHWEVKRLKYVARLQSGESITSSDIRSSGDFPVYGGNGVRGYTNRFTHEGRYALIGRQGALCGNINYASGKFFASEHAVVATLNSDYQVVWFGELLRSMDLGQHSQSAAQPGLAVERIQNLSIPVPSVKEQESISYFVDSESARIEKTISRIEQEIALLQEYRATLINEVVTGKIKVA